MGGGTYQRQQQRPKTKQRPRQQPATKRLRSDQVRQSEAPCIRETGASRRTGSGSLRGLGGGGRLRRSEDRGLLRLVGLGGSLRRRSGGRSGRLRVERRRRGDGCRRDGGRSRLGRGRGRRDEDSASSDDDDAATTALDDDDESLVDEVLSSSTTAAAAARTAELASLESESLMGSMPTSASPPRARYADLEKVVKASRSEPSTTVTVTLAPVAGLVA